MKPPNPHNVSASACALERHGFGRPAASPAAAGFRPAGIVAAVATALAALPFGVRAGGTGMEVLQGQATLIQRGASQIVRTQNGLGTHQSVINWATLGVDPGTYLRFDQPSTGSTSINRVLGNNPSQIFGTLSSNGKLVLVNPSGIAVGAGAVVDTSGFTASTLRLTQADALSGRMLFGGDGLGAGALSINGQIIARTGDVVLIAPQVTLGPQALLQAPSGGAILLAGQKALLTGRGLEGIVFEVQAGNEAVNLGTLQGDAVGIFAGRLKHSGLVQATGVSTDGGAVVLKAEVSAEVAGSVRAGRGVFGGAVRITADDVTVRSSAVVDASGTQGGGTVLVGGGWQGGDASISNAKSTTLEAGSVLRADASANGDGGTVVAWSEGKTRAQGHISARGGSESGSGGNIETSGRVLDVQGLTVDTRAPNGNRGMLLLDPTNLFIAVDQAAASNAGMSGGDVTAPGSAPTGAVQDSLVAVANLETALASSNVTVSTNNPSGTGQGFIRVVSPVSWNSASTLSLVANTDVQVNAPVSSSGAGSLELQATNGTITQSAPIVAPELRAIAGGSIDLSSAGNSVGIFRAQQTNPNYSDGYINFSDQSGLKVGNVSQAARRSIIRINTGGDMIIEGEVASGPRGGIELKTGNDARIEQGAQGLVRSARILLQDGSTGGIGEPGKPLLTASAANVANADFSINPSGYSGSPGSVDVFFTQIPGSSGPAEVFISHAGDAVLGTANLAPDSRFEMAATGDLRINTALTTGLQPLTLKSGGELRIKQALTGTGISVDGGNVDLGASIDSLTSSTRSITAGGDIRLNGTLSLSGAGSTNFDSETSGIFASGGTVTLNGGIISDDTFHLRNGTLEVASNLSIPNLYLGRSSSLTGSGNLTIESALDWASGTASGPGNTTIAAGATANIASVSSSRAMVNYGTINLTGTTTTGDGYSLLNTSGGKISLIGNAGFKGGFGSFSNQGVLAKVSGYVPNAEDSPGIQNAPGQENAPGLEEAPGPQAASVGVGSFTNTGDIHVHDGSLTFPSGVFTSNSGLIRLATDTSLVTGGSDFENSSTGVIKGTGLLQVGAGKFNNHGILIPGRDGTVGTLSISAASSVLHDGSQVLVDLSNPDLHDVVDFTGPVTLASGVKVMVNLLAPLEPLDEFDVIRSDGAVGGVEPVVSGFNVSFASGPGGALLLNVPAATPAPTVAPTPAPTVAPTPAPTVAPTPAPTVAPTPAPTVAPTPAPTAAPTPAPTAAPTPAPTVAPTPAPTAAPTPAPTAAPTPAPTVAPTPAPTGAPTPAPTAAPTPAPTVAPTPAPTAAPTPAPTAAPTPAPTAAPT
ncbi:MAG: filamentous hemagglutinin N-terminal domain-containing protein, partial [Pseudomonadota bacterium]